VLGSGAMDGEILVWSKTTWGSFGQHNCKYTFVIDLSTLTQQPIFKYVTVRHVNQDSRKNIHRYNYARVEDIKKLGNCILKVVTDYKSSGRHDVTVKYYDTNLNELKTESSLRDSRGFYDVVYLPDGRKLRISKDSVEVMEK